MSHAQHSANDMSSFELNEGAVWHHMQGVYYNTKRNSKGSNLSHDRIVNCIQVDTALVGEIIKDVSRTDSLWPSLLVAKD